MRDGYESGQMLCARGAFFLLMVAAAVWLTGGRTRFRMAAPRAHLIRGVLSTGAAMLYVSSLKYLPLADAVTLTFAAPLFVTAMAPFLLGEGVGWRRWSAVLAGFAGVVLMLKPGADAVRWMALLPLGAALCESVRDVLTRRMTLSESSLVMVTVSTAVMVVLTMIAALGGGWSAFAPFDLVLLALAGALFGGAHLLFAEALRSAQAVVVAPFRYTAVVWAALIGFFLWGDVPDGWMIGGCLMVVGSGLYIFRRETRNRA